MPTFNKTDMLDCCQGLHDFSDDAAECRVCGEAAEESVPPITDEERAALIAFKAEYGREWRQYLMAAWLSYSYKGRHMGGRDSGILRTIRNMRGCDWLRTVKI